MVDRGRRHARQDHDDLDGRRHARRRRARSDGHQRRHHQRLRHQRAAGRRRLDGGGVRRIGRLVPAPARDHRGGHQRRSRASRPLRHLRRAARRLRALRREHPVLRLCRDVLRPSRGAGADPPGRRPAHHHLRHRRQRRRARRSTSGSTAAAPISTSWSRTAPPTNRAPSSTSACRCSASTTCRMHWPPSPCAGNGPARRARSAGRWLASPASSAASPRPARRTASP